MKNKLLLCLFLPGLLTAQTYDLLIKGGHIIDTANRIDGVSDIAISGNKIARVAPVIDTSQAKKIVDATGLFVTPGLVDLHAHVYGYGGALFPDDTALTTGTTTVVDAGGSGWRTFEDFKTKVVDRSKTRVLVLINIVGAGHERSRGGRQCRRYGPGRHGEQDQRAPGRDRRNQNRAFRFAGLGSHQECG